MTHSLQNYITSSLLVVLSICIYTPITTYNYYNYVLLASLFFIGINIGSIWTTILTNNFAKYVSLFFIIEVIYRGLGYSTASWGNYANRFTCIVAIYMALLANKNKHYRKVLLGGVFFSIFINCVYSVYLAIYFPGLLESSALLGTEYFEGEWGSSRSFNIVSTDFFYSICFSIALLYIHMLGNRATTFSKLLFVGLLVYFVLYNKSGTALTSLVLLLVFLKVFSNIENRSTLVRKLILVSFIIVIGKLFLGYCDAIIIEFANSFLTEKIADRIGAILEMINGLSHHSDGSLSFEARVDMIIISLSSWIRSFITMLIGVGYHTYITSDGDIIHTTLVNGSGGHSLIADTLARYGLIGVFFIVKISKALFITLKGSVKPKMKYAMKVFFLLLILNSIFNDINRSNILLSILTISLLILPNNSQKDEYKQFYKQK